MHHILCTETRSRPGRTPALVVETTHLLTPADLVDMFTPEERGALAQGTTICRPAVWGSIRWVDLQAFYRSAGGGVTTAGPDAPGCTQDRTATPTAPEAA